MRIFLTGGTGYLGGHVARALLAAGHEVLALVRDREKGASLVGCGASLVAGDLLEPSGWGDRLQEMDAVVHIAALVNSWAPDPTQFDRVNVSASLDLLDRSRAARVERILITSSLFALGASVDGSARDESALDEDPDPLSRSNDYVRTKTLAARRVHERQRRGSPVMMVFPTVLLGPGSRTRGNHTSRVLMEIARKRMPGVIGDGRQIWNLASVAGVAEGFVAALERGHPGENYILGGENWTQMDLVTRAAKLFGVKPPTRRLGRAFPLAVAAGAELWASLFGTTPLLTRGEVRLYDASWSFTSEKARQELGYRPEPVEETLRATVAWLRDEVLGADS